MNVLVYDNEEQLGIAAGNYMCGQVLAKPDSVLGLATGSTPLKPYGHMIKLYEQGAVDFSKVTTFNLDEYCKLDVNDINSYHHFMHDNLFNHINIPEENINFLNGNAEDPEDECKAYRLRAGLPAENDDCSLVDTQGLIRDTLHLMSRLTVSKDGVTL